MNIDVSEIKSFKQCRRQWALSSRNKYHLVPTTPQKALAFGTIFHEALAQLYLGADYDAVMRLVRREMNPKDDIALLAMLKGYADQVLYDDLAKYQVLEVEYRFSFPSPVDDVSCVGAIDLIVLERATNTIYGLEHKTTANFRESTFLNLDEQPRVYYEALDRYVEGYNKDIEYLNKTAGGFHAPLTTNGGIYLNEVRKLLRDFQYRRTLCTYQDEDRENFWTKWTEDLLNCSSYAQKPDKLSTARPTPSYFGCQMCAFKTICADAGYKSISLQQILDEYSSEYSVRTEDHLDTKLDFGQKLELPEENK